MNNRMVTLLTTVTAVVLVLSTIGTKSATRYVWNASTSVPVGLYRLRPAGELAVAQLVAVQPPEPLATFLADGGYLPRGIPMLKRVLALPGQTVCRDHLTITVDKVEAGHALVRDAEADNCPSGRAVALSPTAKSSS